MLKINLLPIRQLKKRARATKQIWGMIVLLLITLASLAGVGYLKINTITKYNNEIALLTKEKNSYTPTLKKIEKLKKEKEELIRKTDVIKKLKADSSLTVRVLDEVANRLDNQRMWLVSLRQQSTSLKLSGIALDNQTVAQFMDKLKESIFIHDVTLANSSLKVVSGRNLKNFEINCTVGHPGDNTPPEDGKDK